MSRQHPQKQERASTSAAAASRCWQQPHTIAVVGLFFVVVVYYC